MADSQHIAAQPGRKRRPGFPPPFAAAALLLALGAGGGLLGQTAKGAGPGEAGEPSAVMGVVRAASAQGKKVVMAGVKVKLDSFQHGFVPRTVLTDAQGRFQFIQLSAGSYRLTVQVIGLQRYAQNFRLAAGELHAVQITLQLAAMRQQVVVRASASPLDLESALPPSGLTPHQIAALPLTAKKLNRILPLAPGVVRAPDGRLYFKGESESQGMLLVDGLQMVDPITGSLTINIPADSIASIHVYNAADNSEYGGFSGSLTSIRTRTPEGRWHFGLHDFVPSLRGRSGHLVGLSSYSPRLVLGGPLPGLKNTSFFENLQYEMHKRPIRGLAWPRNETKIEGVDSFTSFQTLFSPRHLLTTTLNLFPLRRQFANINALVPQSASADYGQHGVSASADDQEQFSNGALLATRISFTRFDSYAHSQGTEDMMLTPEGWAGDYFATWQRRGNEIEALPLLRLPEFGWRGRHELSFGVDYVRRSYRQDSLWRPIQIKREDGSLAEQIRFTGSGPMTADDAELSTFAQDHWKLDSRAALNLGLRATHQSDGRRLALGPRAGLALALDRDAKTLLRLGGGWFYGQVPLLAVSFGQNPARTIQTYGAAGQPTTGAIMLANVSVPAGAAPGAAEPDSPGTSTRNVTWTAELERQLNRHFSLHASYLNSQTRDEFILSPFIGASGAGIALGPQGSARYQQFELTMRYHATAGQALNASYIHSRARGDLNTLNQLWIPFPAPIIRPDAWGALNSDVPNRLLAWSIFHLPWQGLVFSPIVDVQSGMPYATLDELQNYAGPPNRRRFPAYFSFDWKLYRTFRLPLARLGDRRVRLGIYFINFTNAADPLQVFNNAASPNYGQFTGNQHRVTGLTLDLVN